MACLCAFYVRNVIITCKKRVEHTCSMIGNTVFPCCEVYLYEIDRDIGGFTVHFGWELLAEMFVIIQMGNACFVTMRICSITSQPPNHPWSYQRGQYNPVGSYPPMLGTLKQRLVLLEERKRWAGLFTVVNIAHPKASSCFGVQRLADLRGRGHLWQLFSKGERKWKVCWMEVWWKKFAEGTCFFDCYMLEIRKAVGVWGVCVSVCNLM